MNAAVFLDRDNTLIHNDGDLGDPDKVRLIQGAASAIASLQGLGYKVVVVTNQGGVARGKYTEEDVDAVHRRVNELVQANSGAFIDRFYYCPYHPEGSAKRYRKDHPWRKPKPGMLLQAEKHLDLDMAHCWMIGDQLRDIQAGYTAGATPILLDPSGTKACEVQSLPPSSNGDESGEPVTIEPNRDYFVARNLTEAARIIGQQRRPMASKAAAEKKASRVVVEQGPATRSTKVKKKAKKKAVRRKKVATESTATNTEEDASLDTENTSAPTTATERGEVPSRATKAAAQLAEPEIDLETDEGPHAPTLTMPSLSPDVEFDDDEEMATSKSPKRPSARADLAASETEAPSSVPSVGRRADRPSDTSSPKRADSTKPVPASRLTKETSPALEQSKSAEEPAETLANASAPASSTPSPESLPQDGHVDQTLRQILQELRNQRLTDTEFSYITIMAIVLQVVAVICVLAALLMGSGNDQIFARWIACAVVLQLGTISILLFRK